ncbi:hypothetical protein PIB30_018963, partial [Stylosanthes scabra]|nr:hypothetical protein [Stylosanthes scabra]
KKKWRSHNATTARVEEEEAIVAAGGLARRNSLMLCVVLGYSLRLWSTHRNGEMVEVRKRKRERGKRGSEDGEIVEVKGREGKEMDKAYWPLIG